MIQVKKLNFSLFFVLVFALNSSGWTLNNSTKTTEADIVIVGSAAVGQGAIAVLSKRGAGSRILWIAQEKTPPYNKCNLKDYIVSNNIKDLDIPSVNATVVKKFGTKVVAVNGQNSSLEIEDPEGTEIVKFKTLVLGVGLQNKKLEIADHTLEDFDNLFSYYSLTDTNAILNYIKQHQVNHVAIVGSGVNALECASSLNKLGIKISMIGRSDKLLSRLLEPKESQFLKSVLVKQHANDLNFYTSTGKLNVINDRNNPRKILALKFANQPNLGVDMVVYTIGLQPNSEFLANSGIARDAKGFIKTNPYLQTNFPNIYAAGDVALVYNQVWHKQTPNVKWKEAVEQGECLANNILKANDCRYAGITPAVLTKPFGNRVIAAEKQPDQSLAESRVENFPLYMRVSLAKDNIIKSFALINPDMFVFANVRAAFLRQTPVNGQTILKEK